MDGEFEVGDLVLFDEGPGVGSLKGVGYITRKRGSGWRVKTSLFGEVFMFPNEMMVITPAQAARWRIKNE